MKQVHFRKSVMILKTILLVLILSFTFPFYEGNHLCFGILVLCTSSGEQPKPPLHSTDQMQPPAKVDYHNLDAGPSTHAPVQVIPCHRKNRIPIRHRHLLPIGMTQQYRVPAPMRRLRYPGRIHSLPLILL